MPIVDTWEFRGIEGESPDSGGADQLVFDLQSDGGEAGARPEDAFFVKVDSDTTTQSDSGTIEPGLDHSEPLESASGDWDQNGTFDFDDFI